MRSGTGRYLTAADIARRQPQVASDLFRNMPGVYTQIDSGGFDGHIMLRGNMRESCTPSIYLDGVRISGFDGYVTPGITTDDLNGWVRPNEIAGIEVYSGPGTPAQYQQGMRSETPQKIREGMAAMAANAPKRPDSAGESMCGTILIWRK
jgi:outer membrane receptor for ferrienterochelin and colicin